MKTLTSRDICERLFDRIGGFVTVAFDRAPNEFKALYRNRVNEFPGGFRRIDLVPKALLTKTITRDCIANPLAALAILKNWYQAKPELREAAVGLLQSRGYQVVEPDFEKDAITYQLLAAKDILLENDAHYFAHADSGAQFNKLDMTVMVALLGWFPETEG